MIRYPERQVDQDRDDTKLHGRTAVLRPGARLLVCGTQGRKKGPKVLGVALLTKVVGENVDAALVATREYGRRWFQTGTGSFFAVVEELS